MHSKEEMDGGAQVWGGEVVDVVWTAEMQGEWGRGGERRDVWCMVVCGGCCP